MTRRQLFKNFGFYLAGMLALPLFGKPGKAPEPERMKVACLDGGRFVAWEGARTWVYDGNTCAHYNADGSVITKKEEMDTYGSPSHMWGSNVGDWPVLATHEANAF